MEAYRILWVPILIVIAGLFLMRLIGRRAELRQRTETKKQGERTPNKVQKEPVPVLIDGTWIEDNLNTLGCNKNDVIMQLQGQGVLAAKIRELSLVTLDGQGHIWYDRDAVQPVEKNSTGK
ncbi:hypothetical protein CIG75_13860 [Tumebacillus algifaecis]|uniref:DUF421 domain-containing protein n=1 Tax=Tumebacillus algifaecis TaxID=1214604 RepID=A0A223D379_9BACL|nr:hypothetical protein [Tumebacillus algifaecis]ASS75935.1 hypothetical protein CIG75_13860 [Tumebacillus algifaecis]